MQVLARARWHLQFATNCLEAIGNIDILFVPVGGVYTVNGAGAAQIVSQIEPKMVIPIHYALPKLKYKLDGLEPFLKTMGKKETGAQQKLLIKQKDLPQEETAVVVLSAS